MSKRAPQLRNAAKGSLSNSMGSRSGLGPTIADVSNGEPQSDVVFKMCKKIAQLTKVVYYLNTKSEDHETEVNSIKELYELEIENIIADAKEKIEGGTSQNDMLVMQLKAHEEAIKGYMEQIEQQASKLEELAHMEETFREQLHKLTAERDEAIKNYQDLSNSSDAAAELKSQFAERLQQQDEAHERKLAELAAAAEIEKAEMRERYETRLRELVDEKEHMRNEYEIQLSTVTGERSHFEAELSANMQEERQKFEDDLRQIREDMEDQRFQFLEQINQIRDEKDELQTTYEQQLDEERDNVRSMERKVDEAERQLDMRTRDYKALQADYDEERHRANEMEERLNVSNQLRSEAEEALEETKKTLNNFERRVQELEDYSNNMKQTNNELNARLNNVVGERNELTIQLAALTQKHDELTAEAEDLRLKAKALAQLTVDHNNLLSKHEETIKEHHERIESLLKEGEEKTQSMLAAQKEMLDLEHEEILTQRINELEEAYQAVVQDKMKIIEGLEERITEINAANAKHEAELLKRFEDEKTKLNEEIARHLKVEQDLIADSDKAKQEFQDIISSLQAVIARNNREIDALNANITHLQAQIRTLEGDKAELIQRMMQIDSDVRQEMNAKFQEEKVRINKDWTSTLAKELESAEERSRRETEDAVKKNTEELTSKHEREVTKLKDGFESKRAELYKQIGDMEAQIADLKSKRQALQSLLEETNRQNQMQLEAMNEHHQQELEKAKKEGEAEAQARETQLKVQTTIALAQMEKKHSAIIGNMKIEHQKSMNELRASHALNMHNAKQEAERVRTTEVNKLKVDHLTEMAKLREEHEKSLTDTIAERNAEQTKALQEQRHEYERLLADREKELDEANTTIAKKDHAANLLQQKIDELDTIIEDYKEQIADKVNEIEQLKKDHKQALARHQIELRAGFQTDIEKLQNEHVDELQKMLAEFESAQLFLKKQIAHQQKLLKEADIKYANREPREVDVKKIQELEDDVKRFKRRMQANLEELEFYKLELNNREANFNKIFNKQPLVGTLQPSTNASDITKKQRYQRPTANSELSRSETSLVARLPPLISAMANGSTQNQSNR